LHSRLVQGRRASFIYKGFWLIVKFLGRGHWLDNSLDGWMIGMG
jgi:hypothetical protein